MPVEFGRDTFVRLVGGVLHLRDEGVTLDKIRLDVAAAGVRALNLVEPFTAWKPVWFQQNRDIFDAEGIPRWPDLSPAYASWKAVHYPGKTILRRTDEMFDSLTSDTGMTIYEARPRSLRVGTTSTHSPPNRERREHILVLEDSFDALNQLCLDYILAGGGRSRVPASGSSRRSPVSI